jgi:hypothetical protein
MMNKPGVKKSGTISPDREEQIQAAIEETEYSLGALSGEQRQHLYAVFFRFFYNGNDATGEPLKATRNQLADVDRLSRELTTALKTVKKNASAMESLKEAGFKIDRDVLDLIVSLRFVGNACHAATRTMPDSGRWGKHNAAGDLIRDLAIFFEHCTGTPARDAIHQDRDADETAKYSGQFFDFIICINDLLQFKELVNSSMGKFIYDYLP